MKKQIPKEPNQNSSATFEFESLSISQTIKRRENIRKKGFFLPLEDAWLHFILVWHGLCLFSKWLIFVFVFLGKLYCDFSNFKAKFLFSIMLYVIVFKVDVAMSKNDLLKK